MGLLLLPLLLLYQPLKPGRTIITNTTTTTNYIRSSFDIVSAILCCTITTTISRISRTCSSRHRRLNEYNVYRRISDNWNFAVWRLRQIKHCYCYQHISGNVLHDGQIHKHGKQMKILIAFVKRLLRYPFLGRFFVLVILYYASRSLTFIFYM